MRRINFKFLFLGLVIFFISLSLFANNNSKESTWPPTLPTANKNGVATMSGPELLEIPSRVQDIIKATGVQLSVAKVAPKIELVYYNELPNINLAATGWSSWGDICIASDGKVYSSIGDHAGIHDGNAFLYCWDPSSRTLKKVADANEATGANAEEVRFTKIHAEIYESKDKKIYFVGTLNDGSKAARSPFLEKWTDKIAGGKIFQYDPKTGKTIVFADFPKARVTTKMKFDKERNLFYCPLEGHPSGPNGWSLGVFDITKKEWIYEGYPGQLTATNIMLDSKGNLFFHGIESYAHTYARIDSYTDTSARLTFNKDSKYTTPYTTIWKYDPTTNSVTPTNSYLQENKFSDPAEESSDGFIYGTTSKKGNRLLFRYSPSKDKLDLLRPNFLDKGQNVTVIVLSPDEKYLYYLPGAHGSAWMTGTAVIQYNIKTKEQKALAFLNEPMSKAYNYSPGGTYGIKLSDDGSKLYVSFNGSPIESLRTKGSARGFGLCSFAVIHIPAEER